MASTSTPTRQRSHDPNSDAQRTPKPLTAATSSATSSASGAKGNNSRTAAKDLLRDYYGLNKAGGAAQDAKDASKASGVDADPLNIDSPSFSAQAYIQKLLNTSTLAQLLKVSTELSTSISDLEGERQSLVYNHHHELIDASVTISKMKVRAESLDTTLEQLKSGLARCSELNNGLRLPAAGVTASATGDSSDSANPSANVEITSQTPTVDWQTVLGTIIDLPLVMRNASREDAQRLWGTYEPVLRQWKHAGVHGIDDIEAECRQCLNGNSQQ